MDNKIKVVNEIQNYIKENLKNTISLSQIAKQVNYSMWYTAKIFKEVMNMTIFEYIRKLRVTQAAVILRDTDSKIVDVAFDFVFDSHEGFTKAFSREFNITPKAYQKTPIPSQYYIPFTVMELKIGKENEKMETKAVFVQVIERPKRKAIIKRGVNATHYFEYCEEVGCDIWGLLTSVKEAISEPIGMWLSNRLKKAGTSTYVQGVEVPSDYRGVIPDGCELIDLPETLMLVFQGEPYDDQDFEQEVTQVMRYVEKYNPQVHGYEYDEGGYRFQYAPQGYRGYIEGRTIKKLNQ